MPDTLFETRVGFGIDVHPFTSHATGASSHERLITLCGIKFPFPQKLAGHSDADVGLHAIVDALLGAMAEGDIGVHFPADDPKWEGADSSRFLLHTFEILKRKGGEITHLDITFIGEAPRIAPHRDAMRMHIADFLKLKLDRVSVKATTTEKLGFLGRSEGLAAHAVATIRLPI